MDQIINLHNFKAPTLEGRLALARREFPGMVVMYVGRPSVLGNPYEVWGKEDKASRDASIANYRVYLWEKIKKGDAKILEALGQITEDTILACWCEPLPCHSQVIWAAWHWLKARDSVNVG